MFSRFFAIQSRSQNDNIEGAVGERQQYHQKSFAHIRQRRRKGRRYQYQNGEVAEIRRIQARRVRVFDHGRGTVLERLVERGAGYLERDNEKFDANGVVEVNGYCVLPYLQHLP